MSRPTYLRFYLEHNDDDEITCVFCGLPRCEQGYLASGGGRKSFYGVHNSCGEKHMDKMKQTPKATAEGDG